MRVVAQSLEELFSEAIIASMDVMYDVKGVEPKERREYESQGEDPGELLYDIVNYALYLFDEGFAISKATVRLRYTTEEKRSAEVTFEGETYDKEKHGFKTLVKAFTYNDLRICLEGYDRVAEFVLDV